jgi:hypothetical protein
MAHDTSPHGEVQDICHLNCRLVSKVGELVALTALELALKDRYGDCLADPGKKPPMLHVLLRHMVEKDGFTDEILPLVQRYGGSVLPYLYEADAAARRRGGASTNYACWNP